MNSADDHLNGKKASFNLSALAVKEQAVTLFFIITILIAGVYAFFGLGRAEDPTFTVKVFTVTAVWPGATAQEMQDLVADKFEKRMQELTYYDRVETFTRPGLAILTVSLKDTTPPAKVAEEFYQARKKLNDEAHNLPQGAFGPFVNDEYSDVAFALYSVEGKGLAPRSLTREAEALRQRLLHVDGVKKVDLIGERPERIFVNFSYQRLATLGIGAPDIFAALIRQNTVTPAGSIETNANQVFIRVDGAYDDLEKVRATPIVAGGRNFRLSDIAEVKRGYEDPATFLVRHNGEPALLLSIVMKDGFNGLALGKSLEAEQKKIATDLPLGLSFNKITDQAVNIKEAVGEFMLKFFVALIVVMIVSLLSLGWRVGVVVAAAVPLTLASVFVIMLATGRVFDRITLGALILSLGLLVDDAIIAIEIMVVKMEEGWNRIQAASYAWSHTAAPMLAGTVVTIIGLMPVGFAQSSSGEYAGNIFWIVAFALLASWIVAVTFTPYLGVHLLPNIKPVEGGQAAIYASRGYQRLRSVIVWSVSRKTTVTLTVLALFVLSIVGLGAVKQQFFPGSDRPELLVEVTLPQGTSIEVTNASVMTLENWLRKQPESRVVTSYVGGGAPRFFLSYNPELPNPNFARLIVLTPDQEARDHLKQRLREQVAAGLVPEARVRASQLFYGPYTPWPVAFRVMGPHLATVRGLASQVEKVMLANGNTRTVNQDWGEQTLIMHFVVDQDRLKLIGLSPAEVSEQLQFLLSGAPVTQVREDVRTVDVMARSSGSDRFDPLKIAGMSLTSREGKLVPLNQIGHIEYVTENPILKRRDRLATITVQGDIADSVQPPQVSTEIQTALKPIIAGLPDGYKIEMGGPIEEAAKANKALVAILPIMIVLMLATIMLQVRSFAQVALVMLTAPLGLVGAVPILLVFRQPFGFNAILGLIALAGILMRNTLILIGQIKTNQEDGLDTYKAIIEATVQRARPVALTALAAVLAFIPLTFSVFWGAMAFTLIGGTAIGTILTLLFLPALYALWFRITPTPTAVCYPPFPVRVDQNGKVMTRS